jgi:hypothetical protein
MEENSKMKQTTTSEPIEAESITSDTDLPALEEAQPIQKATREIEEERPRKKRGMASGMMKKLSCRCQNWACFGCLSIILVLVLLVLAIYFRPPFLLNPIKKYVNQGYQPQTYTTESVVDINSRVADELTKNGEAVVTEQELQTLMKDKIGSEDISVDIEPSSLRVVKNIDNDSTVPLYVLIEISHTSDDKLKITKLGFQRYGAPKFIRDALTDSTFSLLDASTTAGDNEGAQFINSFVNQDNEDDIAGIRFEKDQVVIFLNQ